MDWDRWPNFSRSEMACKHTNLCDIHPDLMDLLQSMRDELGKPIFISSGYRHPTHPVEVMKEKPGEHALGMAADIICHGVQAQDMMRMALARGVSRIGLHQKGRASGRFLHVGIADKHTTEFQSATWTY